MPGATRSRWHNRTQHPQGRESEQPYMRTPDESGADQRKSLPTGRASAPPLTGGTDHLAFHAVGLPGFQFIQDLVRYLEPHASLAPGCLRLVARGRTDERKPQSRRRSSTTPRTATRCCRAARCPGPRRQEQPLTRRYGLVLRFERVVTHHVANGDAEFGEPPLSAEPLSLTMLRVRSPRSDRFV